MKQFISIMLSITLFCTNFANIGIGGYIDSNIVMADGDEEESTALDQLASKLEEYLNVGVEEGEKIVIGTDDLSANLDEFFTDYDPDDFKGSLEVFLGENYKENFEFDVATDLEDLKDLIDEIYEDYLIQQVENDIKVSLTEILETLFDDSDKIQEIVETIYTSIEENIVKIEDQASLITALTTIATAAVADVNDNYETGKLTEEQVSGLVSVIGKAVESVATLDETLADIIGNLSGDTTLDGILSDIVGGLEEYFKTELTSIAIIIKEKATTNNKTDKLTTPQVGDTLTVEVKDVDNGVVDFTEYSDLIKWTVNETDLDETYTVEETEITGLDFLLEEGHEGKIITVTIEEITDDNSDYIVNSKLTDTSAVVEVASTTTGDVTVTAEIKVAKPDGNTDDTKVEFGDTLSVVIIEDDVELIDTTGYTINWYKATDKENSISSDSELTITEDDHAGLSIYAIVTFEDASELKTDAVTVESSTEESGPEPDTIPTPSIYYNGSAYEGNQNLDVNDKLEVIVDGVLVDTKDYAIQWFRANKTETYDVMSISFDYTAIDGATDNTYTLQLDDVGSQIAVGLAKVGTTDLESFNISTTITESIQKEILVVTLDYKQSDDKEEEGTITAYLPNKTEFGDDVDDYEFTWYVYSDDDSDYIKDNTQTSNTYDYVSIGVYKVEVIAKDSADYMNKTENETVIPATVEITVKIKTQLSQPTIESSSEDDSINSGDTLSISNSSDYSTEEINSNVNFYWYIEGENDPVVSANTLKVEDKYSGKEIYVIAVPNNNIDDDYYESDKSDSVTVETVYYDVTFNLTDLIATSVDFTSSDTNKIHEDAVEYGKDYTVQLEKDGVTGDIVYSIDSDSPDIKTTNGVIKISNVTSDITITAKVITEETVPPDDEETTKHYVELDSSMIGLSLSKTEFTESDAVDGEYTLKLEKQNDNNKLPDTITISFGAAKTVGGYNYDKLTGKITIDVEKFTALSDTATISTVTDLSGNQEAVKYNIEYSNSFTGLNSLSNTTVTEGSNLVINLTTQTGYTTPIKITSIKVGNTVLTESDYTLSGTTLTIKSSAITSDCTISITANATLSISGEDNKEYAVSVYSLDPEDSTEFDTSYSKYITFEFTSTDNNTTDNTFIFDVKAVSGYELPSTISVTYTDNTTFSSSNYTYSLASDKKSAKVTINNVDGNLVVKLQAVAEEDAITYHSVKFDLDGVKLSSGDSKVEDETDYVAYFELYVDDEDDYYSLIKDDFVVKVGGTETTVFQFDSTTGKFTIEEVDGDVEIIATARIIPNTHDLWLSLAFLENSLADEDNYIKNVPNGEDYTVYLKVKSDYTETYELPDSVKLYNIRTDSYLEEDEDYTFIVEDGVGAIKIFNLGDSLNIYANGVKISTDDDTDSDDDDNDSTTYTITFYDASGNSYTTLTTGTDKKLSSLPTISTDSDAVFLGWYTSAGTKITTSTVFTANTSIYARTANIVNPTNNGSGQYYINTTSSNIAVYSNAIDGGTVTVASNYVDNFIIVPPYSNYTMSNNTTVTLPDGNSNNVVWSIPSGTQIDDNNHLNLAVMVREVPINTNTSYGRSLGYVDFAHEGYLTNNNKELTLTFRMSSLSTGDTLRIYKLDDDNTFAGTSVYGTGIGNNYGRANFTTCSRWEVIATNYTYYPDSNGGGGYYSQFYNIPTSGYIAEFRNVQLNQVLDLTQINVGNGLVIEGWYYDQLCTNKVSNPSYVVVTEAIIQSGLYPKYYSDYVTPDSGNPWPDAGNNYAPNLSDSPSTNTKGLESLF